MYQHPICLLLPFVEVSLGELHCPSNQIVPEALMFLLLVVTVIVHFPPFLYQGSILFPFLLHPSLTP